METRASWIFKWKHLKHSKYSKNSWLEWSNKDWKGFSKKLRTKQTLCENFSQHCLEFPENCFNFVTQKFAKNRKMLFQTLRTYVFEFKVAWKPFSKKLPMIKFYLNSFEHFASQSQKMVSTLSVKILQKTKKCYFQTPTILVLELKEASKPFS